VSKPGDKLLIPQTCRYGGHPSDGFPCGWPTVSVPFIRRWLKPERVRFALGRLFGLDASVILPSTLLRWELPVAVDLLGSIISPSAFVGVAEAGPPSLVFRFRATHPFRLWREHRWLFSRLFPAGSLVSLLPLAAAQWASHIAGSSKACSLPLIKAPFVQISSTL
jgi:hypothetical protein